MKKAIFILTGLILLFSARVYAYKDGDFQVWSTNVEELKINKNLKNGKGMKNKAGKTKY